MRYALGILLMVGLWGGLTGRNNLDAGFQQSNGPTVRVVSDEVELKNALGYFAGRAAKGLYGGTILLAADIVVSGPIALVSAKHERVEVAGLGLRTITTRYTGSPVFSISAGFVRIRDLRFSGTHRVGGTDIEINGAERLQLIGLVGGATNFLATPAGASVSDAPLVHGSVEAGHVDIATTFGRFTGNYIGSVTLQSGSSGNLFSANQMTDVTVEAGADSNVFSGNGLDNADDSASNGNNILDGNRVYGSAANWTGAGSVAADNT